jgi:HK97 family phage portal protein
VILDRLFERRSIEDPRYPLTAEKLIEYFGGPTVHAGVQVSETSALTFSAVKRAVDLIAGSIAALPIRVWRERNDGREQLDQPWFAVEPYPDTTAFEFWEWVYVCLLLTGNAYLLKIRNEVGTQVVRLLPVSPWSVGVEKQQATPLNPSGKIYKVEGVATPYTPFEMLHIPGMGYDGVRGISPIMAMRQAVGLGIAAEEFGARFFGSGALLGGILQTDQEIPEAAAEALKRRWREKVAGVAHAHEVAILDRGAKFERIGIPPEDGQFLQTRQFQVQEIARFYGVPLHLLMDAAATSNWGTGVEQHGTQFIRYTLRSWMSRVEQRISSHLLPRGQYAEFNADGLMRGSATERANFYAAGLRDGWLTVDEIRDWEGLTPLEGNEEPESPAPTPEPESEPEEIEEEVPTA